LELFFFVGVIIAAAAGFAIGKDAEKRGMDPVVWGLLTGLFLFPFLFVYLAVRKPYVVSDAVNLAQTSSEKTSAPEKGNTEIRSLVLPTERLCPHCAETIKSEAKICRFCQRDVPEDPEYSRISELMRLQKMRSAEEQEIQQREIRRLAEIEAAKVKGKCPNCSAKINADSGECPNCKADFSEGSAWKIEKL